MPTATRCAVPVIGAPIPKPTHPSYVVVVEPAKRRRTRTVEEAFREGMAAGRAEGSAQLHNVTAELIKKAHAHGKAAGIEEGKKQKLDSLHDAISAIRVDVLKIISHVHPDKGDAPLLRHETTVEMNDILESVTALRNECK